MADLKLVGAVAIKVRPDARGFKGDAQKQIDRELAGVEGKAKLKLEADTAEAKSDVEKAAEEIKRKKLTLKVGVDYDSVRKAQQQLNAAVKGLEDHVIKVVLDEEGIAKAQHDIDELMDSAQVEMTFVPDEKGFKSVLDKIAAIRREKLEMPISFDISDEELDALEESMNAALFEPSKIELTYGNDRASLEKAISAIKAEQDKIEAYDLPVLLDPESLQIAREQLEAELSGVPVELRVNYNDQGSLKQVRDRLRAMLTELGSEKLEVLLNEEAIQEQLDRISGMITEEITEAVAEPTTIKFNYNLNRSSLMSAIGRVDAELDKVRQLEIEVGLADPDALIALREKLQNDLQHLPVELTINYNDQDSLKQAQSRLRAMLNETIGQKIDITMDEEKIRAELQKVEALIKDEIPKEKKVEIPVEPTGLEIVARQLQFASRARRVPFYVVVDQKSVAVAEGLLRSLTGVNTLQSLGRGLESIITKFDTFSLKTGAWAASIGSLVDALFYMTSSVFTVGEGMLQVVGLAALAPTAFASLASVMLIGQGVFKDFGAAVNGDSKALEKLTDSGKKAAGQVRTVFQDMRENISKEFWGKASDSMLRFTETALPAFTRGLVLTSGKLGQVFAGILDSFTKMGAAGGLDKMYGNLGKMFDNAAVGATALWDAFNLLGLRGSEFLPKFGTWLAEISTQFHNWLVEADKNGNISTWINEGVTALQDMWYATGALIDQFKAVASAAGLVGESGLDDFRRNMEHIAKVMNAEPWQTQMGTIFDGARNGARELMDGFQDLGRTIMDSAGFVSGLLILLGQLGGEAVSRVADVLGNFDFQQGSLNSLRGINEMMRELEPGFESFARVLGTMGDITAEVFRNLAPVVNSVLDILDDVSQGLEKNVSGIVPTLLNLANNLISFFRGPVETAFRILDGFLGLLNSLPGPLKDAAVAFGVFLLLRNQFGAFARSLSTMWTKMTTSVVKGTAKIETATAALNNSVLNGVPTSFRKMADGSIREVNRFGTIVGAGMTTAETHVKSFSPGTVVPQRMQAMNTATATHMTRFRDIFANGVTTATATLGTFTPTKIIDSRLGGLASATAAHMSRAAGAVGRGIDNMSASLQRFQPATISDRLSRVASGIPGIVSKINGALSLIGGLPGIALGLIGVLISTIGANAAESARQVDELKESLDKSTGDATVKTLETIAERMTDIGEAGDGWANFWRGVVQQSKAGNETLETLGTNVQDVAKIITGSRGEYDKFIGSLKDLGNVDNLKAVGQIMQGLSPSFKATAENLTPGAEAKGAQQDQSLERLKKAAEAAKALKLNPDIFSDPAMLGSLNKLTGDIEEQRRQFELSQLAAKLYGDQLGLSAVKGQQMASAMAIIRDTSLDATSKIDAMNRAMELLNGGGLSEQEAAIHKADALERLAENARNMADSIAKSRKTLFIDGTGMLNDQNAAARGLFEIMREGADNVKISAKAAYDAALANGDTAEVAMGKARQAIKDGNKDLQTIADNAGLTVDELKAQWGKFFNEPWVLEASIMGTSEQFKTAMTEADKMGIEFDGKDFQAFLLANPDPAKVSTEEILAYLRDYAAKTFTSKLDALPKPARDKILQTIDAADAYAAGDYQAVLDAWNNTDPGIRNAVWAISTKVTNPKWQAMLYAALESGSLQWVEYQLNYLARNRTMNIAVTSTDLDRDDALANRVHGRNGAILDHLGRGMHGFAGEVKYFANGGIENHVAQIQRAGGPVRIWAEPETHAEAYIPYASSKRPRSLAILAQVAKDFGYTLNKATEFSNGGMSGRPTPSTHNTASVHIGQLVTADADEAVRKIRISQQDALAVAGISLNGA